MRQTIAVEGARENNLKNVSVEIPRDRLVVVTGMSGSGKSSLAFDTVFAEGQRRFMESLSSYAKRFIAQLKKPDVDFVHGLSPVVSIEQKTTFNNPRSTVGTMTDIYDYLRMLFATVGTPHCPYSGKETPVRTPYQMAERLLSLPQGTQIEVRAPIFKVHGEDWAYLFDDIRTQGCRYILVDGKERDLGDAIELDEDSDYQLEAIVDRFIIKDGMQKQIIASLEHGLKVGDGFLSFFLQDAKFARSKKGKDFYKGFVLPPHNTVRGEMHAGDFTFNEPAAPARVWAPTYKFTQTY